MASGKPAKPDVVTYGDHEMITPDTSKLRKTLRPAPAGEADPVARAEAGAGRDLRRFLGLDAATNASASMPPAARSRKWGCRSRPGRSCSSPPTT